MDVYFTTVVRAAPLISGGELVRIDWRDKKILGRQPIFPPEPCFDDPNPRGNGRGGRGIVQWSDRIYVATYHTLLIFDRELNQIGKISHDLFVSIHELHVRHEDDSLWVAATAIDAAIGINASGTIIGSFWPRETPFLQEQLSLTPLAIDKERDNRTLWLHDKEQKGESHTHLNAVACYRGEMYILLNRYGLVYNSSSGKIILEKKALLGCHNLVFLGNNFLINDSRRHRVFMFSLAREMVKEIKLLQYPEIRALYQQTKQSADKGKKALFVRGLYALDDERILVGFSPATVAELDLSSGKLVDFFNYSEDVAVCIHGLMAWA